MIQILLFSGALAAGLLFIALFPRYTGHAVRRVRRSFWNTALIGGLAFVLLPAAAVLAVLTVIGIPVGLLLAAGYLVLLYVSKIVVGLAVGGILLQRSGPQPYGSAALTMAVGLLLLYFLASLPIVGSIGTIIIMFTGLGGLILALADIQYGQRPPPLRGVRQTTDDRTQDTLSREP
jgi:hypothetical protein